MLLMETRNFCDYKSDLTIHFDEWQQKYSMGRIFFNFGNIKKMFELTFWFQKQTIYRMQITRCVSTSNHTSFEIVLRCDK